MTNDHMIEHAEHLLANVCGSLVEAVGACEALDEPAAGHYKRQLADALVRAWEARDVLFAKRPDLRPSLMPHADTL